MLANNGVERGVQQMRRGMVAHDRLAAGPLHLQHARVADAQRRGRLDHVVRKQIVCRPNDTRHL